MSARKHRKRSRNKGQSRRGSTSGATLVAPGVPAGQTDSPRSAETPALARTEAPATRSAQELIVDVLSTPAEAARTRHGKGAVWALRLLKGALAGAVLYAALFGLSLWLHRSAEYMGVEDAEVTGRISALFEEAIVAQQLGLLLLALSLGAGLGLAGAIVIGAVVRRRGSLRRETLWIAALVLGWHQLLLLSSMASYPAVYAPQAGQSLWIAASLWLAVDLLPAALVRALLVVPLAYAAVVFGAPLARRALDTLRSGGFERQLALAARLGVGSGLVLALAVWLDRAPAAGVAASGGHARPNVLILAVDSLRSDALEVRDGVEVAPNLRAFAAGATHFTRAIPTIPRTYPSWASMLTGQYPHHHGIRHMFPAPPPGERVRLQHSLATILQDRGYRTAVFSDFAGDVFARGDFGFAHVEAPDFTLASNVALGGLKVHLHLLPWLIDVFGGRTHPELLAFERLADPRWVRDRFYRWLGRHGVEPYFAVVFLSAGHFPFASPSPFWRRFADPDYRGPSRFLKGSFTADLNSPESRAEAAHLKALHEGAVAASDDTLGDILRVLRDRGHLDNTIVVLTADHGEGLYEHGLGTGHGDHLYGRETLEVPLVLDFPGNPRQGLRVETPVSLADITPTILGLLGETSSAPAETIAGVNLAIASAEGLAKRPVFAEIDLWFFPPETRRLDNKRILAHEGFDGFDFDPETGQIFLEPRWQGLATLAKHRMVLAEDRKLLYIPTRDGVRLELYDPLVDPGDHRDLAGQEPDRLERLRAILYDWMLLDPDLEEVHGYVLPRAQPRL